MPLILRFGFMVLAAAAIGGVIWGFRPSALPYLGWIVLGSAAFYGVLSALLPERIRSRRLGRRPSVSFEEIYRTSFQELPYSRGLIEDLWNELAYDLHIAPSKIRPTDRFGDELSVRGFPLVDINEAVDARLRQRLREAKAGPDEVARVSSIRTLRDHVHFACQVES